MCIEIIFLSLNILFKSTKEITPTNLIIYLISLITLTINTLSLQ